MFTTVTDLVTAYDEGKLSRRGLLLQLGTLIAAVSGARHLSAAEDDGENTFQSIGVDHVALRVTDVRKSRDFYRKHLGLKVTRDGGDDNCFLSCGDDFLALFRGDEPRMDHYCFAIKDYNADRAVAALKAAGLKPHREENRVYLPDPDGLTVQVSAE